MYTHGVQEKKSHKESDLHDDKHMAHWKGCFLVVFFVVLFVWFFLNFRHLNPTDFP